MKTNLTIDKIPEQYRELADELGMENLIKLSRLIGGCNVYIPREDRLARLERDSMIKRDSKQYTCKQLAVKYSLSESRIRAIIAKK